MFNFNETKMKEISFLVLRASIAFVVMWFGYQQLSNPEMWLKMLPDWTKSIPLSSINFIYINGWFEMTFGFLLLVGFYTRLVAFLIGIHLLEIVFTLGYGPLGIRDLGLAFSALSIFFYGSSKLSIDNLFDAQKI
jgi:uncharacterized membrane protein YphA (DoxX/SURF4 family)